MDFKIDVDYLQMSEEVVYMCECWLYEIVSANVDETCYPFLQVIDILVIHVRILEHTIPFVITVYTILALE